MNYPEDVKKALFGTSRQTTLLAVGLGVALGICAWIAKPLLGASYWLWPASPIDWAFVVVFLIFSTGAAFYRSGFLAAWWANFPAHIALAHYNYQSGFVVLPFQNDFLSYVLIAGAISLGYAGIGFLLGTISRWRTNRSTLAITDKID